MTETAASLKSQFVNKTKSVEKEKNPSGSEVIIFCTQKFYRCFVPKKQNSSCDLCQGIKHVHGKTQKQIIFSPILLIQNINLAEVQETLLIIHTTDHFSQEEKEFMSQKLQNCRSLMFC